MGKTVELHTKIEETLISTLNRSLFKGLLGCICYWDKDCLYLLVLEEIWMNATVSILTEIPEELHDSLQSYLETHPDWDQDRVFTAALSLFLLQNGNGDRRAVRVYLESLFQRTAKWFIWFPRKKLGDICNEFWREV